MYTINDTYLRPKKAAWLKRMYATPFEERSDLALWSGKNATIFPLRELDDADLLFGRGGVLDENGDYVPLSAFDTRINYTYPFENPVYRDEKVVYCGYLVDHWGHFLVEAVTRLWYVLEQDPTVDKYVFFFDENQQRQIKGNYQEFFDLLTIGDKVEVINTPTTYREVIVPEPAFFCMRYYSPRFLEMFDFIADHVTVSPDWKPLDKIFFTRSSFAKGNNYDFGLESLDSFFQNNGFTLLAPETVTLSQLIYYIRNASEIATISGSVHHNMLFGRSGQKLTIVERLIINDDHQVSINRLRQLQVTAIDANYHLYPVDTCGPYVVGYNRLLESYTKDSKMSPPSEQYTTARYREHCFRQYMRSYQDNYRYRWFMAPWYAEIADSLFEAYEDNYPYFQDYLDGNRPFLREHYFQWHYFKQFVKRLLRRRMS